MGNSPIVLRINSLLAEKGISKKQFYKDCGITSASFSLWNTGKTFPREKSLQVIAEYLETTTDYLRTGIEEKTPQPLSVDLGHGEIKTAPDDGDGMDDITKELIDFVKNSSEDERRALAEMVRLIQKQRGK